MLIGLFFRERVTVRTMKEAVPYPSKTGYDEAKADRYDRNRPAWRHNAEMALLEPAFKMLSPKAKVLDAPCGAGRVSVRLAELGMQVTAVDISAAMLERAREKMKPFGAGDRVTTGDLEKLQFADREFEAAVCFRFFSHLPNDELRGQVISELCRVSQKYVIISFFHPIAMHNLKRAIQKKLGKPQAHSWIWPDALAAFFSKHGFQQIHLGAQSKYLKALWLAVYQRQ
jgi:ubiquinone/menaquinone biosynthesis C-methylase UbiE